MANVQSTSIVFLPRATMVIMIFLLLPRPLICAEKIDAKIDIALVISDDNNYDQTYQILACRKLMSYFKTGEENARFALSTLLYWRRDVQHTPTTVPYAYRFVLMNLTGDPQVHRKVLENVTMPWRLEKATSFAWSWAGTIKVVRERVIAHSPAHRLKAVVVFLAFFTNIYSNQFTSDAQLLRDTGALVYVITKNGTWYYYDDNIVLPYANNLTGNSNRTIVVGHTDKSFDASLVGAMDKVRDAILLDLCQKRGDTACTYKEKEGQRCEMEAQSFKNPKECALVGLHLPACTPNDCQNECDRRWPWERKPCVGKCGVDDEGERNGTSPPAMMENCPKWMACPPCTTPRPTTAITTNPPTASNATDPPTASNMTNPPTARNTSDRPTASSTSDRPTASSTSDRPTASSTSDRPTASSTTVHPALFPKNPTDVHMSGMRVSSTTIGVIIGVLLAVFVILIIVSVIITKKRRNARKKRESSMNIPMVTTVPLREDTMANAATEGYTVGGMKTIGVDAAVAADLSDSESKSTNGPGTSAAKSIRLVKSVSGKTDARKSTNSALKAPSLKSGSDGKPAMSVMKK